ncbi:MAG TPA: hypothetical protein VKR21_11975, partial [Solirubrobacteraceae bacterium]|nr:hypothetical protein [Solirubrobacteraceae bacterium]
GFGRPIEESLPGLEYADSAAILGLVEQRLLPIRHAPFANCLVRRSCFTRYGLPDTVRYGPYAPSAWTAAVVARGEAGYFAPLSIVRLAADPPTVSPAGALGMIYPMLRMSRSGTWTTGESVEMLMRLARQAVGSQRR